MKNAILFDLDGTIINTLEDLCCATNYALNKYGYKNITIDDTKRYIGNGNMMLIKRSVNFDLSHVNELYDEFIDYYKNNCDIYSYPYDGIHDLLIELKNNNIKLAVVTNKNGLIAQKIINKYFPNIFDLVIGDGMGFERKPKPDMINYVMKVFNINKDNIIYIGDSEVDIETANNINCDKIIVSYGFRDKNDLLKKCDDLCDSVSNLKNILNSYLK